MTFENSSKGEAKGFSGILSDYTGWFTQALRRICYPGAGGRSKDDLQSPTSFLSWLEQNTKDNINPHLYQDVKRIHDDFITVLQACLDEADQTGQPPGPDTFDDLITLFEEFSVRMRRLEKDLVIEDAGIDVLTGLRTLTSLEHDFSAEMDRLARQGKQFCLAYIRIDNLKEIKKGCSPGKAEAIVKKVATMIKKSLRSFDDIYHSPNHDFVLLLKQTNMSGGVAALERLKDILEEAEIIYNYDGHDHRLTLSSCIAQPAPGDALANLLANLKQDLIKLSETDSAVLKYAELSPLQRYAMETST